MEEYEEDVKYKSVLAYVEFAIELNIVGFINILLWSKIESSGRKYCFVWNTV